jgi:hypothetical protein
MTSDLNILQPVGDQVELGFSEYGTKITGKQWVAQEFVTMFMTERGTVRSDPAFGTDFMFDASVGAIRSETNLVLHFGYAVSLIKQYVDNKLVGDEDEDEVFAGAVLNSFSYEVDKLILDVTITVVSGQTLDVVIPIAAVEV